MTTRGIGQIGLGGITVLHREAYRLYGQPVVAGYDPDPAARERFAADTPGATVHTSLESLLADPRVEVLDVAVPHHAPVRRPVVAAAAAARLPMLLQKPFAETYADAVDMLDLIEAAGVPAMVNQNMCFTPGALPLVDALMKERVVGEPDLAVVTLQYQFDTDYHPWFGRDRRWWTGALTVHHLGLLQLLFGPPESVDAAIGRDVAQPGVTHDGYGMLLLRYPSGLAVQVTSTGTYYGTDQVPHGDEKVWVQGPAGLVDWRPAGGLDISVRADGGIARRRVPSAGPWFPDAFGLTMAHFRQALERGVEPLCSARDNLHVVAVIEAAYRSGAERRSVRLDEVMGDRFDPHYGTGWSHGFGDWTPPTARAEVVA